MKYLISYKIFEEYTGHSHVATGTFVSKEELPNFNLPEDIENVMMDWDIRFKSPYSNTFYNTNDIGWGHKPDGSLRVSDHWNFYTRGKRHCETKQKVRNNIDWCIGKYDAKTGKYDILQCSLNKKQAADIKRKAAKVKYMDPEIIAQKKEFKELINAGKVHIDLQYDGKSYSGIVKRYTGPELKIVDENGVQIFGENYLEREKATRKPIIKLSNIETGESIPDPFKIRF